TRPTHLSWDGAGLYQLSVGIKDFGEPAPTGEMLQKNCLNFMSNNRKI
ncbi:MAG: hypothetical protein RLZZ338_4670, partial [Cyanobacteriota bacterium]